MKNSPLIKILKDIEVTNEDRSLDDYKYQIELTEKLTGFSGDFTQEVISEIVLWKVNRYCKIPDETRDFLNEISKDDRNIDVEKTKEILRSLLAVKGIRLPMASTILRFKNPCLYQIIDQRAYRILTGKNLKTYFSSVEIQIKYYLDYLADLRVQCDAKNIKFELADQILYQLDKKENTNHKIKV